VSERLRQLLPNRSLVPDILVPLPAQKVGYHQQSGSPSPRGKRLLPTIRFPVQHRKRLLSTIRFPFPLGKGLGVRFFASRNQASAQAGR
jgi:hypothetical protein